MFVWIRGNEMKECHRHTNSNPITPYGDRKIRENFHEGNDSHVEKAKGKTLHRKGHFRLIKLQM